MQEIGTLIATGLVTLAAAFGGAYLQHRTQRKRDLEDYERKRSDTASDVDRASLREMIGACGELHMAISVLGARSSRFPKHPQFPGVSIPMDDLVTFQIAKSRYVTAYSILKSDPLTDKAAAAIRAANDVLLALVTCDLNDLNPTVDKANAMNGAVAAWARLLYYGRDQEIDWDRPPVKLTNMSNHPLEEALRDGALRAHRPAMPAPESKETATDNTDGPIEERDLLP